MWTFALSLLSRFAQPLLLVALVGAAGLLIKCGWDNRQLAKQVESAKEVAASEAKKRSEAEARFDDLIRDYNEQARASAMREAALHKEREDALIQLRTFYETRIGSVDRSLQLALDGLRHSAAEDRRRALKAAADAPAPCGSYAADRANISVPDAAVALGIAADGDRAAVRLAACQRYITEVVKPGVVQ